MTSECYQEKAAILSEVREVISAAIPDGEVCSTSGSGGEWLTTAELLSTSCRSSGTSLWEGEWGVGSTRGRRDCCIADLQYYHGNIRLQLNGKSVPSLVLIHNKLVVDLELRES